MVVIVVVVVMVAVMMVEVLAVVMIAVIMSDEMLGHWHWSIIHCLRVFRHKKTRAGRKDQQTDCQADKPSYRDASKNGWTLSKNNAK